MPKKYFGSFKISNKDELVGDTWRELIRFNINVASDTTIQRGTLLAADSFEGNFKLVDSTDTGKVFAIALDNFTADSDSTVTQAYTSGVFNKSKVIVGEGVDINALKNELRKQNIHFTDIKDF